MTSMPRYTVRKTQVEPPLSAEWRDPAWAGAETLEVAHFRPEGSEHRPATHARLLYDDEAIHGIFHVADRFVRCVHARHNDPVCRDSAVEFFVQSRRDRGYLNFEFNCGGALLAYYITDHRRVGDGFAAYTPLPESDGAQVLRRSSLPSVVEPEMPGPVEWTLQFRIPHALLEKYAGPTGELSGQRWRANFYKCGDETSHPHWAAWSPVSELNFHLPECFGEIRFE
jgi:hypothetical protein